MAGRGQVKARTLAPSHPSRPRMCLMCFKIFPRVSEDHPDRSWMLQMGSLSPLSTTYTGRLLSFWNGRRSSACTPCAVLGVSGSCTLRSVPYAGKCRRSSTCRLTRELKSAWSRLACVRQSA